MFQRHATVLVCSHLTVLAAGCGTQGASSRVTAPAACTCPAPSQAPPAQAPAVGTDPPALLAQVAEVNRRLEGFSARLAVYEKTTTVTEHQTLDIAFKRPATVKIHFVKSSGESNGVKALWTGGDDMRVKPKWMPFPVSMRITEERMRSYNGWTIRDTQPRAILTVLLDPQARRRLLGDSVIGGRAHALFEVTSAKSPAGITREVIGVDRTTMMPLHRELYRGETLAYRVDATTVTLQTPSEADLGL
jgi:hypothetical protein